MEKPYHRFVFDIKNRKFIGKFEKMYQNEEKENYDSWNQLKIDNEKKFTISFIKKKNFKKIIDFGCGKGLVAKKIKNNKNFIVGLDISKTAIEKAKNNNKKKVRFIAIKKNQLIENVLKINKNKYDLIICNEVLSYLKNWKKYIKNFSSVAANLYIALFIPNNPIGYVKNLDQLKKELSKHYSIKDLKFKKLKNMHIFYCTPKLRITN